MEPIPVFFDRVHRSLLIVTPKKPFKDWLVKLDPEDADYDYSKETDFYLIPDFDDEKIAERWIKENFDDIFCDQLNNWYTDEADWVPNRTFKTFKDWFDYKIHLRILDTVDIPIRKSL